VRSDFRCCPRPLRLASIAIVLAAAGAGCTSHLHRDAGSTTARGDVTIKLIALNDFHGHLVAPPAGLTNLPGPEGVPVAVPLGGVAYVASEIKALQAQNPYNVVVGAGDLISASPLESALYHDEPAVQAMNQIGLVFSSVGNHEFDHGREALLRMQAGGCAPDGTAGKDTCVDGPYTGARYQYLAANVIDETSGKPFLPAWGIKIFDTPRGPVKIAFIGLVLKGTPDIVAREGLAGLRFEDEADTANALIPEIEAQGIRSIVVLIHQGGRSSGSFNDKSCPGFSGAISGIVQRLDPAIAVVLSAHTHNAYNCHLPSRQPGRRILVTSAGSYGRYVTDVELRIDPKTDIITRAEADNIPVVNDTLPNPAPALYPTLTPDPAVAAFVAEYEHRTAPQAQRVIGRVSGELGNTQNDVGEMGLGELIADGQLDATASRRKGGAQIAFMNPGGVRSPIKPGPGGAVTFGQVYSAQPFSSRIVTVTLTGRQLHALLEAQWEGRETPTVLLPSRGFSYAWKKTAAPGAKVDPKSITLNGKPVKPERRFRIAISNFLADGGDGFKVFSEATDRSPPGDTDRDVTIAYIARHSPVPAPKPGRIKRID
jgi:5'-nucleotidase